MITRRPDAGWWPVMSQLVPAPGKVTAGMATVSDVPEESAEVVYGPDSRDYKPVEQPKNPAYQASLSPASRSWLSSRQRSPNASFVGEVIASPGSLGGSDRAGAGSRTSRMNEDKTCRIVELRRSTPWRASGRAKSAQLVMRRGKRRQRW